MVVDAEEPAPEGWCYCQVARHAPAPSAGGPARALTDEGLVPWCLPSRLSLTLSLSLTLTLTLAPNRAPAAP